MATPKPLREAPRDLPTLQTQQSNLTLPHFTSEDAWTIGSALRTRLQTLSPTPAAINISLTNHDTVLFHATTHPGIAPDNSIWIARKRNTVKRFGVSSWMVGRKFDGDEAAFARKMGLGEKAGEYAIHGGGVPVRVEGVEGVIAVIVVSGLKQDEDHMVVVEALEEFIADQKREQGGQATVSDPAVALVEKALAKDGLASTHEARVMVDEQKADGAVFAS